MSQALLISNNEVVNSMYEVNLRAYVAMNITVKTFVDDAVELLELNPSYDVIIIFSELLIEGDCLEKFESFLTQKNLDIPVIILGDLSAPFPNAIVVKNKYNIKMLLQSIAKILEVTAQEMASLKVGKFFSIPLHLFSQLEEASCDIYNREKKSNLEYQYDLVLPAGTPVVGFYNEQLENGTTHFYIDSNERLRFINLASRLVVNELDRKDLSNSERMEISKQGMNIVADEVFASDEISAEVAEISKKCIESISTIIKKVPGIKNLLKMLLEGQNDYCYRHSVLNSFFASKIIDNMSWGTPEQKDKVNFALFFHDIYLVPLYRKYQDISSEEDLLFMEGVTEEDKQRVLDHAKLAGQMIKTFPKCPMGADQILIQHHGMTSGQGFAINFKDDISPLAKIMIISEEISVRIISSINKGDALEIDKDKIAEKLLEKYRNHTYRKIIEAFRASNV